MIFYYLCCVFGILDAVLACHQPEIPPLQALPAPPTPSPEPSTCEVVPQVVSSCEEKNRLSDYAKELFRSWRVPEKPEEAKCHIYCILENLKWLRDGRIQVFFI